LSLRPAVPAAALFGVLALVCAWNRSVWMDELHSLFHADAEDLKSLLVSVRRDNHPPLYFLILGFSVRVFGSLRLPSIVCGIATVLVFTRLSERVGSTWAARIAPFFLAGSSLLLTVSTEARMYSLLALAVIGMIRAVVDALDERSSPWWVLPWVWVGLHTHYFMLHYLLLAGSALAVTWALQPHLRRRLVRVAKAGLAAGALSLPWYLWGFRQQLLAQSNAPGASDASLAHAFESVAHLFFYNVSLAGEPWRTIWLVSAAAALLLAPLGALHLLRAGPRARPLALLAIACSLVPFWSALVASVFPRAGFGWLYVAPSAAPLCLVIGALPARSCLAGLALFLITLSALGLSVFNALSPGTEDYEGAVAYALEQWQQPGSAGVLAIEPGPSFFPASIGWSYCTRGSPHPELIETTPEFLLRNPDDVRRFDRVIVLARSLGDGFPTLLHLRGVFRDERVESFGYNLIVYVFSHPRDGSR
jgi:4-amino-4-deoxy-L-arabinose transferase-like glycosyltransferase